MIAIFIDSNEATNTLTHAVKLSAVPVFGHVQVVGLGMAQSLSQRMKPRAEFPAPPSSPDWALLSGPDDGGGRGSEIVLNQWFCTQPWLAMFVRVKPRELRLLFQKGSLLTLC